MDYLKKMFKNLMLANIFWLICTVLMVSSIHFTNGYVNYNPTVLNVTVSTICGVMTAFSSMLARSNGKLFKKIFGY